MCRLLGFVAQPPTTLRAVLDSEYDAFLQLARDLHGDGWGMAWPSADGVAMAKQPVGAHDSPEYADLAGSRATDALLVHLRWATLDLGVSEANTHPFGDGRMAFAHNGSIYDMPPVEELAGRSSPAPLGDTDSERYWLTVRAASERAGDPVRGLAEAVLAVARVCTYSSLNALLLTPDALLAVCWYEPSRIADGFGEDYYELAYDVRADRTVVASSGWPRPGWEPLPNHSLLVLPRDGGVPRVHQVEEAAALA